MRILVAPRGDTRSLRVFCEGTQGFTYSFLVDESEILSPVLRKFEGAMRASFRGF